MSTWCVQGSRKGHTPKPYCENLRAPNPDSGCRGKVSVAGRTEPEATEQSDGVRACADESRKTTRCMEWGSGGIMEGKSKETWQRLPIKSRHFTDYRTWPSEFERLGEIFANFRPRSAEMIPTLCSLMRSAEFKLTFCL